MRKLYASATTPSLTHPRSQPCSHPSEDPRAARSEPRMKLKTRKQYAPATTSSLTHPRSQPYSHPSEDPRATRYSTGTQGRCIRLDHSAYMTGVSQATHSIDVFGKTLCRRRLPSEVTVCVLRVSFLPSGLDSVADRAQKRDGRCGLCLCLVLRLALNFWR